MPRRTEAVPCLSIVSINRASVWAVAVIALGAPSRACSRRQNAPTALWRWGRAAAARRSAVAARWAQDVVRRRRTLPPETRWGGQRPHHDVPCGTGGVDVLRFLMEEHGLTQSDLPEVGLQGVISDILRGKRELNVRQIRTLAKRFHVSPAVFI
jgi:hypothetical protein